MSDWFGGGSSQQKKPFRLPNTFDTAGSRKGGSSSSDADGPPFDVGKCFGDCWKAISEVNVTGMMSKEDPTGKVVQGLNGPLTVKIRVHVKLRDNLWYCGHVYDLDEKSQTVEISTDRDPSEYVKDCKGRDVYVLPKNHFACHNIVPGGVPNPGDVLDPMEMSKQLKAKHLWS